VVPRGERGWAVGTKLGERDQEVQNYLFYKISYEDVTYSMGNTINNIASTLYGDRW